MLRLDTFAQDAWKEAWDNYLRLADTCDWEAKNLGFALRHCRRSASLLPRKAKRNRS